LLPAAETDLSVLHLLGRLIRSGLQDNRDTPGNGLADRHPGN
jgi:hypothetical protein